MQKKQKALQSQNNTRQSIRKNKDKKIYLTSIRNKVQKGTSLSIAELKSKYNQEELFLIGLRYVKTTNKAFCLALNIPIQNGCRAKRKFEKRGLLFQSKKRSLCKISSNPAYLITTNKKFATWCN